jgi:hypothetical protein
MRAPTPLRGLAAWSLPCLALGLALAAALSWTAAPAQAAAPPKAAPPQAVALAVAGGPRERDLPARADDLNAGVDPATRPAQGAAATGWIGADAGVAIFVGGLTTLGLIALADQRRLVADRRRRWPDATADPQ